MLNLFFFTNCNYRRKLQNETSFFYRIFFPLKNEQLKQNISKWIPESENDDVFLGNNNNNKKRFFGENDDEIGYSKQSNIHNDYDNHKKKNINYFINGYKTKNQLKYQNDDSIYHEQSS